MRQLYHPKVFENGSMTPLKSTHEALCVEVGDIVCFVISKNGVEVLKSPSNDSSIKVHADAPTALAAIDADEEVINENRSHPRELSDA